MSFHGLDGESWTSIAKHRSEEISRRSVKDAKGRAVLLCCPTWCCSFQSPSRGGRCCITELAASNSTPSVSFSPLLVGDGVASDFPPGYPIGSSMFQSPSRGGRCCILGRGHGLHRRAQVSVPFSWGTVLHRKDGMVAG